MLRKLFARRIEEAPEEPLRISPFRRALLNMENEGRAVVWRALLRSPEVVMVAGEDGQNPLHITTSHGDEYEIYTRLVHRKRRQSND